jgi:hypothetical protein
MLNKNLAGGSAGWNGLSQGRSDSYGILRQFTTKKQPTKSLKARSFWDLAPKQQYPERQAAQEHRFPCITPRSDVAGLQSEGFGCLCKPVHGPA